MQELEVELTGAIVLHAHCYRVQDDNYSNEAIKAPRINEMVHESSAFIVWLSHHFLRALVDHVALNFDPLFLLVGQPSDALCLDLLLAELPHDD